MSRLLAAIAGMAALLGLVGQLGRVSVRADVINFVAPFWLVAGGAAGLAALLLRPGRWTRAGAGWSLAVLGVLAVLLVGRDLRGADRCDGPPLTIVQYNMFKENVSPMPALVWLAGSGADVILLEEAHPLARYRLAASHPVQAACSADCSTLILSRHPFRARGGLARDDPENRLGLSAVWAEVAAPSGRFTVVAAHFDRPWPFNGNAINRRSLAAFVRTRDPATTIVGGDFNLPAWSYQARALEGALGLRRLTGLLSWPAPHPVVAIDHLFAGRQWAVERIERGPPLGSDHYPLVARLRRCA